MTALDRIHRAKVEVLLGERGFKADHAVRFRDLSQLNLSGAGSSASPRMMLAPPPQTRSEWREDASLSRSNFCLALYHGGILLAGDAIEASRGGWPSDFTPFADTLPGASDVIEAQIIWAGMPSVRRMSSFFEALRAARGMTAEDADELFGYEPSGP